MRQICTEEINCCKPSIFQSCGGSKGLPCSLCWRENEAVCHPRIILEPTILSGFAESSWERIRVWPSNGRSHNTMQGGWVPNRHLSLEWPVNHANGYPDRLDEANLYRRDIFLIFYFLQKLKPVSWMRSNAAQDTFRLISFCFCQISIWFNR